MSDISSLAIWGAIAGLLAGFVLHRKLRGATRARVARYCVVIGIVTVAFYGLVTATEFSGRKITKAAWGYLLVGYPALVAGIVMVAFGRLGRKAPRRE